MILRDVEGREVTRTLTDAQGRFRLVSADSGRFQLQTARVGWQPWYSPWLTLGANETLRYTGDIPHRPVGLSAVVVRGERTCGTDPGTGREIARVWDEARKALAAVSWTQRTVPLTFEFEQWRAQLHGRTLDTLALDSDRRITRRAGSPFGSLAPEMLSEHGYVHEVDGDWVYEGPDADVLLSPAFAGDHCFFLLEEEASPQSIGLAFEPVRGRRVPDISGVLWIDRRTAALTTLEFRYVDLPWEGAESPHVGGRVAFASLETGGWIVREWRLRMPVLTLRTNRLRWDVKDGYSIVAFQEVGARVVRVTDDSGAGVVVEGRGPPSRPRQPNY